MTGLVMGTPGYLAPEIVEGAEVSEATDWWGWAATLAFAATGRPPFGRGPMEAVLARVARGESDLHDTDPDLRPLLRAALDPHPDNRPSSTEVVEALRRYAAGEPVADGTRWSARTQVIEHVSDGPGRRDTASDDLPPPPPPPVVDRGREPATAYPPIASGVSDWEAAMGAPAGVDPRIGRPGRSAEIAAVGVMLTALAAAAPLFAFGLLVTLGAVARTADRSVTSLILRRTERGVRRSDVPLAVAASPLHFVLGFLGSIVFSIVPLVVAVGVMFTVAFVVSAGTGGVIEPIRPLPLAAGAVAGALAAWWGPGGASLRRGTRSLVRGMTPVPTARQVFLIVLGVIALGSVLWLTTSADLQPTWWPSPGPPELP